MSLQYFFARGQSQKEKDSHEDYKKEDITLRLSRKLADPITRFIFPVKFITPNQITWFGFFLTIFRALVLIIAEDNVFLLLLVFLSYWLSAIFDCVDGQLARKRGISSKKGEWLDSVLEEGKGFPFFIALGLHIQDINGFFTLELASNQIGPFNVWLMLFLMYGAERWIALMAVWGNIILDEPRVVSHGVIYIVGVFIILNILDWFLVLFTIGVLLAAIYTLFEKTFLLNEPTKEANQSLNEPVE